jgi:hypothetical protein
MEAQMQNLVQRFAENRSGAVLIKFAVLIPVVFTSVAMAIDYGSSAKRWSTLQQAADAAALGTIKQLTLVNQDPKSIESAARDMVLANLSGSDNVSVQARMIAGHTLEVQVGERIINPFGKFLNYPKTDLQVTAVARISTSKLCLLALEQKESGSISLKKNARITGLQCSFYSNSKDRHGIKAEDFAEVDAELVCSAGGIDGKHGHFRRQPLSDCPAMSDPLAGRRPPTFGGCDYNKTEIKGGFRTLSPGVYCGGLKITSGASVTLKEGVYIIQGGKLVVDQGASLTGRHVGFYLAGKESSFEFGYASSISLTAPLTGVMASLLFFDDRDGKWDKHRIYSNDARTLLGTIYLPNGSLYIDSKKPIADKSAYTILVTRKLELYDGPNLVLNSNYGATNVPVPNEVVAINLRSSLVK